MADYLVTGGGGFIGSHLVERLVGDGHRVRVLDDFSSGTHRNLEAASRAGSERLEVVIGDIRDPGIVARAVAGMDGVFHYAARGSVPRSVAEPVETNAVNVDGTLNLLVASRDAGVRRLVFAGSSSVYGALRALPKNEDHPTVPTSPYGLTKLAGEQYTRLFRELYEMDTVTLRFFNVFGPRQNPDGPYAAVIPRFIRAGLAGGRPRLEGDGEQSRDFTYVANVVDASLLAIEAPPEAVAGGLFNIAAGGRHSLKELIRNLERILGRDLPVEEAPPRPGDIRHSQADITLARDRLGFDPRVSFAEGLERSVENYREAAAGA